MHRVIQDHLEQVLAESHAQACDEHLDQCDECRGEIEAMRKQARLLRELRVEAEPRAGFYARVMERIEAQRATSIWNVFSDSPFRPAYRRRVDGSGAAGRRIPGDVGTDVGAEHRFQPDDSIPLRPVAWGRSTRPQHRQIRTA